MKFLVRRFVHAILLLVGISILSFALLQWAPGGFFDSMRLDPRVSVQTVNGMRTEYGLDQPFMVRYARWIGSVLEGDMGFSLAYGTSVGPLLWTRAKNTLLLAISGTLLAWLMAVPIGIWSASRKGTWSDKVCGIATSTLLTIPDLLLALMLLLIAVRTGWFPTGGMISVGAAHSGFWSSAWDVARHLILPAFGLALVTLPVLVRHVRSAMIDALESPFIQAARGHGVPHSRLLFRYALPAASNPLISLLGFSIATMLSASVIIEVVLSWPGLGPLMVQAILARDAYVVIGVVMLSSVFLVMGNLASDILLFVSDPRIRVE
ncbi:MAG TPA: ABC transporter permease [Candidatus Acidoferrales bacterium]|nr:ABC transporter permease [Candidatus Acidoferrales bacterium]